MRALKHLNKYFLKYKYRLIIGIFFVALSNIFAIIPAQLIREAFDMVAVQLHFYRLFEGFSMQERLFDTLATILLLTGGLILLMALIKGVFLFFMRQTIIVMSRLIEYDLKNEVFDHYQTLSLAFYKRNNTGDLMNRISEDVSKVRMYIGPAVMYTINLLVLFILVISTMLTVNPKLTLYSLLPLPILSVSIYFVSNAINRKSERVQRQLSKLSTIAQESFSGTRVIKAYNKEKGFLSHWGKEAGTYNKLAMSLIKTEARFHPMMILLIGLSTILTIFIGGKLAIAGEVTTGNIAEFVIYVNMLTWPVAAVGWVTSLVQRAAASQERINEFLNTKADIVSGPVTPSKINGKISFHDVSFTYPDSGIKAIQRISFEVNPGETIAIIGKTGSGKSTLANLACRLYNADTGEIKIDDIPIEDLNLSLFRKRIGYVPQEVFLFSDTIENNIAFGLTNDEYTPDMLHEAASKSVIAESIESFPEQYKTHVGERGVTLSGGQKQRISIARAIVREPDILLFDDCLSAVDTETEERILTNLKSLMANKTTILISHRVSTVKEADRIYVMDQGTFVESGTHEDLLAKNGIYADQYQTQIMEESERAELN